MQSSGCGSLLKICRSCSGHLCRISLPVRREDWVSDSILNLAPPEASHRVRYGPGIYHFADLRIPDTAGPHPIAIAVHGGFWGKHQDLLYLGHVCEALRRHGVATWNVEYRRVGQEGGGWPGTLQDVGSAADHLQNISEQFDLDLDNASAFGHSAGGHLALWLAARSRIPRKSAVSSAAPLPLKAAFCVNGVSDLRQAWELNLGPGVVEPFMGGAPSGVPLHYASASPTELLPFGVRQMSKTYCHRAKEAGDQVTLLKLEGCAHFEPIHPRTAEGEKLVSVIANQHGIEVEKR